MQAQDDFVHLYDFMSADEFATVAADLYEHQVRFRTHKTGSTGPEYLRMQSGLHELELWVHNEDLKVAMQLLQIEENKENANKYGSYNTETLQAMLDEPLKLEKEETEDILNELQSRGNPVSENQLNQLREKHIQLLNEGVPAPTGLIATGFLCAFGGGFLGLFVGFRLMYLTDVYPQGEEFFHYNKKSRILGKVMLAASAVSVVVFTFLYLVYFR